MKLLSKLSWMGMHGDGIWDSSEIIVMKSGTWKKLAKKEKYLEWGDPRPSKICIMWFSLCFPMFACFLPLTAQRGNVLDAEKRQGPASMPAEDPSPRRKQTRWTDGCNPIKEKRVNLGMV